MKMTFDQYIQNPMGVANAVISNREMYRNLYRKKFDKILVREAGKIDYKLYAIGHGQYLAYIKIPSEVIKGFYYDVLIEFTPPKKMVTGMSLKDYTVRFYSNDPSFVFTFTHAFAKNDLLIKFLEDKMSKRALKERAKEKNPSNQVGYVKSLYFAYLFMSRRGLFAKVKYIDKFSESALKREITDADKKVEERQELQAKLPEAKRKIKAQLAKDVADAVNNRSGVIVKPNLKIRTTGTIGRSKSIGKINTIKTVKRK